MSEKQISDELRARMGAFLDETVEHYAADPNGRRCVRRGLGGAEIGCFYDPVTLGKEATSEGCAIGRKMTRLQRAIADIATRDEHSQTVWREMYDGKFHGTDVNNLPAELMPETLKGMPRDFLREVQALHDDGHNWNKELKALTLRGKDMVAGMRRHWGLDQ